MVNILIVGCGAVGSVFATELCKKVIASPNSFKVTLLDFDTVEERNIVAQDFSPSDIDRPKAEVLAERLNCDRFQCTAIVDKLTMENVEQYITPDTIVIDGLDCSKTRSVIWQQCYVTNTPILHIALSQQGSALINWSFGRHHDTFHMSPLCADADTIQAYHEHRNEALPPCYLTTLRPLIFQASYTGVLAFCIYFDMDLDKEFERVCKTPVPKSGVMLDYYVDLTGRTARAETAGIKRLVTVAERELMNG